METICWVIALACLRRKSTGYFRGFRWFLALTIVVETCAWLLALRHQSNHWLYNVLLPVEAFFTGFVLYRNMDDRGSPNSVAKYWFLSGAIGFVIAYAAETFQHRLMVYNRNSFLLTSIWLILGSGLYYLHFLRGDQDRDIRNDPAFWCTTGIFLFYFGSTAATALFDELIRLNRIHGIPLHFIVFNTLSLLQYACWSYAFLCKFRQTISLPSPSSPPAFS